MIAPVHLLSIAALAGLLSLCVLGSLARSGMAGIGESIRANLLTLAAFGGYALQVTAAPLWLSVLRPMRWSHWRCAAISRACGA